MDFPNFRKGFVLVKEFYTRLSRSRILTVLLLAAAA